MKIVTISNKWPSAISDGLELPCSICNEKIAFDYHVNDDFWAKVVAHNHKLNAVCLPCLDNLAHKAGFNIAEHLEFVQFTGIEKTIVLLPDIVYYYTQRSKLPKG